MTDIEALRGKWKLVDGDCREGANGLITYHVDAFDEGRETALSQLQSENAALRADAERYRAIKEWDFCLPANITAANADTAIDAAMLATAPKDLMKGEG